MLKNYFSVLLLSFCLLGACKSDKEAKPTPVKKENQVEKAEKKKPVKAKVEEKTEAKVNKKTKRGYWPGMQDEFNLPDDKLKKLQSLEKDRRTQISKAQDKDKPAINKKYTALKKELLGNKMYRAYRDYHKNWIKSNN